MNETQKPPREPEYLREKMRAYRAGFASLPPEYVAYHRGLAEERKDELVRLTGMRVLETKMIDDGWFDGFKVLQVIVETVTGKLMALKWNDSNRDFMKRCEGGGHAALYTKDLL